MWIEQYGQRIAREVPGKNCIDCTDENMNKYCLQLEDTAGSPANEQDQIRMVGHFGEFTVYI